VAEAFLISYSRSPAVRALLDHIPCPIGVWSQDHLIGILNYQAMQLVGAADGDFAPGAWINQIDPHDRMSFTESCKKLQNGSETTSADYRFFKRDGTKIWLRDVSAAYRNAQGETEAIISTYSDVSELKTNGAAPAKGYSPESLESVIGPVIHEIKNNLHAIRMEIDLLLMDFGTALTSNRFFQALDRVNRSLQDLREYLLAAEPEPSAANPKLILEETVHQMTQELEHQGILVKANQKSRPPLVWIDSRQLRKALERVIEFCRALLEQGGKLEIETGLKKVDARVYVEITLTACSSSSLELDEKDVFRPFLRVNNHQIGLGMALAQQILRRNHGMISFSKETPRRAQISILLKPCAE
jgi:PAS domain S-box-containing protein